METVAYIVNFLQWTCSLEDFFIFKDVLRFLMFYLALSLYKHKWSFRICSELDSFFLLIYY